MARELKVVIATTGRAQLLERTLRSLAACEKPANFSGTIIIENGPPDRAEAVVSSLPAKERVEYRHTPRANKSYALNLALDDVAEDCLVLFTDDDVRFAPEILNCYAEAAQREVAGRYFGGPFGIDYETPPPAWLRKFLPPSAIGWEPESEEQRSESLFFFGCNWAAFAGELRCLGGFNPEIGIGSPAGGVGEETDMQMRLRKTGSKPVYLPEARVWHYVPSDRCSPKWALHRAYRNGLHQGMQLPPDRATHLFGIPRWQLRQYVRLWRKRVVSSLSISPQKRFEAIYQYRQSCGILKGMRLAGQVASATSPATSYQVSR